MALKNYLELSKEVASILENGPEGLDLDDVRMLCVQTTSIITGNPMVTLEELAKRLDVDMSTSMKLHHLVMSVIQDGVYH